MVDWTFIRMQYEVFGESLNGLAENYGISLAIIQYTAESQKWSRLPVASAGKHENWTDSENVEDEVLEEVNSRLNIIQTLRQQTLNPRYIAVESSLLTKTRELLESISPDDPMASNKIKAATDVLKTLADRDPSNRQSGQNGQNAQGTTLRVAILQSVGKKETADAGEYTIEIEGGPSVAPRALPSAVGE